MRPTELYERFEEFLENEWDIDEVYSIVDFRELFQIDIRLARYYLVKFVDEGRLFYLRWDNDVYYCKMCWYYPFKEFINDPKVEIRRGVKVCR